jgi:hypothetical protein
VDSPARVVGVEVEGDLDAAAARCRLDGVERRPPRRRRARLEPHAADDVDPRPDRDALDALQRQMRPGGRETREPDRRAETLQVGADEHPGGRQQLELPGLRQDAEMPSQVAQRAGPAQRGATAPARGRRQQRDPLGNEAPARDQEAPARVQRQSIDVLVETQVADGLADRQIEPAGQIHVLDVAVDDPDTIRDARLAGEGLDQRQQGLLALDGHDRGTQAGGRDRPDAGAGAEVENALAGPDPADQRGVEGPAALTVLEQGAMLADERVEGGGPRSRLSQTAHDAASTAWTESSLATNVR